MRIALLLLLALPLAAQGAELTLPGRAFEREGSITAVYRIPSPVTGSGQLSVEWTDIHGRVVEDRTIAVDLRDESEIRFSIDLSRAAAMSNRLRARLRLEGRNLKGAPVKTDDEAEVSFVARPAARKWWDYEIIMWQPHSAEQFAVLKGVGISGGQYNGKNRTPPDFLVKNDLRWYAENIATDYYAEYHRWRPDRIQQWSFLQAKELYRKDMESKEALKRRPSFSDPSWQRTIRERLMEAVRVHSPYRPFFYSLADETGIADLAAFWDFDFSDSSLDGMREWLKQRYGTLTALNRQWGSDFAAWDRVMPDTTRQAMRREDGNYSAWADHKEWMDISYAGALKMGADAVRSIDPEAYTAIGGAQMPGWGGYDYSRIAESLTAIEPYDIGGNIEILRSLNPRMAVLTTSFARGSWEKHRVWYELLHGNRGLVIWDEKHEFVSADRQPGARARETAPYYRELRDGLGALIVNSRRLSDPIAIHYSQPSMRTEWMLARKPKGDAWIDRSSSTERMDSELLRLRESYCRLIEDLGLQYEFVAYGQVERGELPRRGYRVLILPRSSALSDAEAEGIRAFVKAGGVVIADGEPGVYDEHSRKRTAPVLGGLALENFAALEYHRQRVLGKEGETKTRFGALLAKAGIEPPIRVTDAGGAHPTGLEVHTFRNGGVTILALLSNPELRVNELGPPEFKSNQRFEKPVHCRIRLPGAMQVYDARRGKALGGTGELTLDTDPYEPSIYVLSPTPLAGPAVSVPPTAKRGTTATVGIRFGHAMAERDVVHITTVDPAGKEVAHYSRNLLIENGSGACGIPLARNDPAGVWRVKVRHLMTGATVEKRFEVLE